MAFDSTECAWRDLEMYINGGNIVKFTSLKENPTQDTEYLYGGGDEPFDINTGNRGYPITITLYKSVRDKMDKIAQEAGYPDLLAVPWTIVANYKATATAGRQTTTYPGVRFSAIDSGADQNQKGIMATLNGLSRTPVRVIP